MLPPPPPTTPPERFASRAASDDSGIGSEQLRDENVNLAIDRSILILRNHRPLPRAHVGLNNLDLAAPDEVVLAQKIDIGVGVLLNCPHLNGNASILGCLEGSSDKRTTSRACNSNNNLALLRRSPSKTSLSIQRHVDQEGEAAANSKSLLNSSRVLGKTLVAAIDGSILPRSRDDDAAYTTEVGVVNLNIENLTRDARNDGVRRTKVDPGADDCSISVDSCTGEQTCVLGG
ncbi:hypothetical protein HG530_012190 [Fusarium avenaceum]|nr:hypothetical protein HG530_012190 [Fusarium avenaceum]